MIWYVYRGGCYPQPCDEAGESLIHFNDGGYGVYVRAEDKEHAIKRAQDMIAQYEAEQLGL